MSSELKRHLGSGNAWMRILIVVLFAFIYSIAEIVLAAVILLQILFNLFTGKSNENLLNFGRDMSRYVYQIFIYLTYNSDTRPFPFEDWESTVTRNLEPGTDAPTQEDD